MEQLMYRCGHVPNYWYSQGRMGLTPPEPHYRQAESPEDIDCVYSILLDGFIETENVAFFSDDDAYARWDMLSGRAIPPADMDIRTAVAFAEAIWMSVLSGDDRAIGDGSETRDAFMLETAKRLSPDQWGGRSTGWEIDGEAGLSAGTDLLVEAWAAGAPIETVLAG